LRGFSRAAGWLAARDYSGYRSSSRTFCPAWAPRKRVRSAAAIICAPLNRISPQTSFWHLRTRSVTGRKCSYAMAAGRRQDSRSGDRRYYPPGTHSCGQRPSNLHSRGDPPSRSPHARLEARSWKLICSNRILRGHKMSTKRLHFGIIGAGRIGRVHAETLAFRCRKRDRCHHRYQSPRRGDACRHCNIPQSLPRLATSSPIHASKRPHLHLYQYSRRSHRAGGKAASISSAKSPSL